MKLELKFNSGTGALLCSCAAILATGFDHHEQSYCCPARDCCKKWYVTKHYYTGDIYGYDGKLIG